MPRAGTLISLRVFLVLLLTWSSLSCGPSSRPDPDGTSGALNSIGASAIRGHVRFLADDLLEGRGTGTRGYDLAASYVASQFDAMGLDPGGVDGTFFQPIAFREATLVPERSSVVLIGNSNGSRIERELEWGTHYLLPSSSSGLAWRLRSSTTTTTPRSTPPARLPSCCRGRRHASGTTSERTSRRVG